MGGDSAGINRNPCQYCVHIRDDSDESVGLYGYACAVDAEWDEDECGVRPCPCFKAILPSDDLYWQLADEQEAEWYKEMESESKEGCE